MDYLLYYLCIINLIGFLAFWLDKRKAQKGQWRIPEKRLFLFAFLGGGIGCTLGMKVFRHKTKHLSFVIGIPMIMTVELIAITIIVYFLFIA